MRTARLVLKQNRFEVIVLGGAILVLTLAILYVATRMGAFPAEIEACGDPVTCRALQETRGRLEQLATPLILLGVVLPIFVGLMFGVPLVAREVERGTASLPWAMSRSRHGWFLRRVAILGVTLAVITALPSIALDLLTQALFPDVDMAHSFMFVDERGPIVGARALAAFGVGALSGALTGRALPGLLLALVGSAMLFASLAIMDESWLRADAVPLPDDPNRPTEALIVSIGYDLPDGRTVDWETAVALLDDPNRAPEEVYPYRYIGVPAQLAPEKRAREIGVILLAGLACVGAATLVVGRRRPY